MHNNISLIQAATGIYSEDFTTTIYLDEENTNTTGWGTGLIENSFKKPNLVGSLSSIDIGDALNVFVEGDYAHIVAGDSGYHLVNITDISNPFKISSYNTAGYSMNLQVDGEYVYIADHDNGLVILNITDPFNPTFTGSDTTNNIARDVAVYGDYAYIADSESGLTVVDISNPKFPNTLASYSLGGSVYSVIIEGRNAFITNGIELQIIDISNPISLSLIGSVTCNDAIDVAIDGNTAYVSAQDEGVIIVNITSLQSPTIISSYSDTYSVGIDVDGDYVCITDLNGFFNVIDVSDLKNPKLGTFCNIPAASQGLIVVNKNAFVACYTNGLRIIEIKDETFPSYVSSYDTPSSALHAYVSGDLVYVADYESGVQILNISDPSLPSYVGSYDTPRRACEVIIDGDYAYIPDQYTNQILNVSDPFSPLFIGSSTAAGQSVSICVSGNYAYVADYLGLEILDISNPSTPSLAGFHSTSEYTLAVDVAGDYAYTAVFLDGIQIIDVSDPSTPKLVGSYDTSGSAYDIEVKGDLAFVADQTGGFLIFNVSDHTNPELIGSCVTPGSALNIFISGNYAYVGDYQGDFLVIDISDPTNPTIIGIYDVPAANTGDLFVHGDYAYVGCQDYGLYIVEISKNKARQYDSPCVTQSTTIFSDNSITIDSAKLISDALVPSNTLIKYYLSADNGVNWEEVANNTEIIFTNVGYQLKWKAVLSTNDVSLTPKINCISITYKTTLNPPSLVSPIDHAILDDYTPSFSWDVISGVAQYLFQLDTSTSFTTPMFNITLPSSSPSYTTSSPLALNTYYWRVAGIDSGGDIGEFSNYRTLEITLDTNTPVFDHPNDVSYELGTIGNTITWKPIDSNPYWYNITLNGLLTSHDDLWLGGDIVIDIDGLSLGTYTVICYVYDLEGLMNSDSVEVDVVSTAPPTIDDIANFDYEEDSTGNSITWHPSDTNPDYYSITRDGTVIDENPWFGEELTINIDGLAYGVYTYVCTVNDTEGQEASDSVIVTVTDSVDPVLNSPSDIIYSEGDTGNTIIWVATDNNPTTYTVYLDGELYTTDTWYSGSSIIVSIDGLTSNQYNFTITVRDQAGNVAKDTVIVGVTATVSEYSHFSVGLIFGTIAIIVILLRRKKE